MQCTQGALLEYLVLVIRRVAPMGPTEHLLHRSALLISRGITDLANALKTNTET